LYLTPVTAALITMFFDRQMRQGYVQRAIAVVVITFATSAAAIANLISGTHPFKRNSAVPYQAIFDLIDRNANGKALVVSTDPVVPWVLRGAEDRCAGYFLEVTHCLRADRSYDSIFVISGHHDRSEDQEITRQFNQLVAAATAGRRKLASVPIGRDEDASLKSRLTGVPLEKVF
jgi:hypothetical protein